MRQFILWRCAAALVISLFVLQSSYVAAQHDARPRLDPYGDELPKGAISRFGTIRFRHGGCVSSLAFAPDGKSIISIGPDAVRLLNVKDGVAMRSWTAVRNKYGVLSFAQNGRFAYVSDRSACWQLDVKTGQVVRLLGETPQTVGAIAVAPDSATLALAFRTKVMLVAAATGETIRELQGHQGQIRTLAFSPNGATLASGADDKTVRVWDVKAGTELRKHFLEHEVQELAYFNDGSRLAVAAPGLAPDKPGNTMLLDAHSGEMIWRITGTFCRSIALAPDNKSVLVCDDKVRMLDAMTGEELWSIQAHYPSTHIVRFSPDGKTLCTAGGDSTIKIWDAKTGECRNPDASQRSIVSSVGLGPSKRTAATGGENDRIRFWDVESGARVRTLDQYPGMSERSGTHALAFLAEETVAIVSTELSLVKVKSGSTNRNSFHPFRNHDVYWNASFCAGGKYFTASTLEGLVVTETANGKALRRIDIANGEHVERPGSCVSCDGRWLAAAQSNIIGADNSAQIRIWDIATGKRVHAWAAHEPEVHCLTFSPDSRLLATGGSDSRIRLWDPADRRCVAEWVAPEKETITSLAFSADGRTAASGSDSGTIRVWERSSGLQRSVLPGHLGEVRALQFSNDGQLLISGSADTTALVWNIAGNARPSPLSPSELDQAWNDLASKDAGLADRAIWRLALNDGDDAVSYVKKRLSPTQAPDAAAITHWIAELDHQQFSVRQGAENELARLEELAAPALRAALASQASPERTARIKALLDRAERTLFPETLRSVRAVEFLEHRRSPEARALLKALAGGIPEARLTTEARDSLARLNSTPATK
jgi:WD40 repeat protein